MDWTKIVTEALTPLIGLLLTLALGALFNWLLKAAGGIKQTQLRESLTAALNQAQTVALDAVTHTQQILVDELKARSEDGILTKDEAHEAMVAAMTYFKGHISPWALSVLQAAYGPIDEWLRGLLEAKLGALKWGEEAYAITVPPSSPASEPAPGPTV